MRDISAFYILGIPIQTEIGECEFIKVKEYPEFFTDLQVIAFSKDQIVSKYTELNKDGSLTDFINQLKGLSLYEIATGLPELKESYYKVFFKVFNGEEALSQMTSENFSYFRSLILKMNCQKEEKINPNPEIQRALERSKRVKSSESDNTEFSDLVSSVVGFNGLSYKDINEFTIYQLYMTYYRIGQFKSYDTSTLFATVSTEKIKIDSWSKHINLFEEEKHFVSQEEFKKSVGSAFNE